MRNRTTPSLRSPSSLPALQINLKLLSASCVSRAFYQSKLHLSVGVRNTLMKNLAASLNLHFHTAVTNFLLTPCATFHGRQLKPASGIFFPLSLKNHTASYCLRLWSLAPISHSWRFISSVQVHFKELSSGLTVPA